MLPQPGIYQKMVQEEVNRIQQDVIRISHAIHSHPEIGMQEHRACRFLVAEARARGFQVETPVAGMETGFVARFPSSADGPRIAFLCEYDALPDLGHACGHNIIAAASFGAAMALIPVVYELGGTIFLIGTPDEEAIGDASKGGKVVMSRAGIFDSLDAAFMMHPTSGKNAVWRYAFPLKDFTVQFHGKPAHYTQPEKGINALESLLMFLNNVNSQKRSWSPSVMLAFTITDGGGPSAITVPKSAKAHMTLKAFDIEYLESRFEQVQACVRAVSEMTGARGHIQVLDEYRHMIPNLHLAASLFKNMQSLGEPVESPIDSQRNLERQTYPGISTDFSDVSWVVPAIHGYCSIGDSSLVAHTPEFAEAAGSEAGNAAAIQAAKAMAMSAADILSDKAFAQNVKTEFLSYRSQNFRNVPGIPPQYLPFPEAFLSASRESI
jgi:amidohydrolase